MLTSSIGIASGASGGTLTFPMDDNVLITLGNDADIALLLRSAVLNADTALTGVLIGTPDTHALAANSLIIANKTADGDILIAGNDGGTSRQFIYCDVSVGNIYLGGKDGTPGGATGVGDTYTAGNLEVDGTAYLDSYVSVGASIYLTAGNEIAFNGVGSRPQLKLDTSDANAQGFIINIPAGGATYVPVVIIADTSSDYGLFDGITQPLFVPLEKAERLTSMSTGIADAGAASAILKKTGGFTNSVVGDIVRMTAGTNVTTGWYWITTKTSNDQVTLDRNFTSGDTTNATCVIFHNFPMIGADGVCLKCFDGTPADSNTEIDRDGWTHIDVGSNQLYFRSNATYRAVQNAIKSVTAHTGTDTLAAAESGSVHTNLGDGDGSSCKLPAAAVAGTNFTFALQAAQEFRVIVGAAGEKIYAGGVISTDDGGDDLYISADDEGESITLCSDGAGGWFVTTINGTWSVTQP